MIHPTALVHPEAKLHPSVEVGPWCTIGPNARIGKGTRLISHVVVDGHTTIGEDNAIYPFAVLGAVPQDLKYKGEPTRVEIGHPEGYQEAFAVLYADAAEAIVAAALERGSKDNITCLAVFVD